MHTIRDLDEKLSRVEAENRRLRETMRDVAAKLRRGMHHTDTALQLEDALK